MTDWIKYDGTNKPDDGVLVRVRFPDGWVSDPDDWESAGAWSWGYEEDPDPNLISHFQLKDKPND